MLSISGVYEVAIRVKDLDRAEAFYTDVLGLEVGLRDEPRRWLFLRAGGQAGMCVLQEDKGDWPSQHFAFTVAEADIDRAAETLKSRGVAINGPTLISWMPAKSVYFADPDGHSLELCAPIRLPMTMEDLRGRRVEILRIAEARGASNVRVFGSVARGEARPDSDVDFLVDLAPERTLFDLGGLIGDLEEALGRRVDVVEIFERSRIAERIQREAIPL
jgi:predicted nucleotidyltransferase/catechol 2,3-dioxygenase-like lactoylglutathione lyase family enzyme